jgi:hypothetical protein
MGYPQSHWENEKESSSSFAHNHLKLQQFKDLNLECISKL